MKPRWAASEQHSHPLYPGSRPRLLSRQSRPGLGGPIPNLHGLPDVFLGTTLSSPLRDSSKTQSRCLRGRPPHLTFPMYARSRIVSVIFSVVLAKVAKTPSSASQPRRSESDESHLRVLVCVGFLVRGISAVLRLCVELSQCAMNCSSLIFDEERLATAQSQNEMIRNLNIRISFEHA